MKKGTKVKVNQFLTTDPIQQQGNTGVIIDVNQKDEFYTVEFEGGITGYYSTDEGVLELA